MAKQELKELIIAYREQGLSYKEIAEKTGTTDDYARTICSRSNRKQRKNISMRPNGFCYNCSKPLNLSGDRRNRLFCDNKCRSEYHNLKASRRPFVCTCENCGHDFIAYGNPAKRFCSDDCRVESRSKNEAQK